VYPRERTAPNSPSVAAPGIPVGFSIQSIRTGSSA